MTERRRRRPSRVSGSFPLISPRSNQVDDTSFGSELDGQHPHPLEVSEHPLYQAMVLQMRELVAHEMTLQAARYEARISLLEEEVTQRRGSKQGSLETYVDVFGGPQPRDS
ncbi:hypothetical protein P7C70_g7309, partial [Phenoliferia sp. Uapishka_3]